MHGVDTFDGICPDLAATLQPFVDHSHYELQHGVLPSGEKVREHQEGDDDDAQSGNVLSYPMVISTTCFSSHSATRMRVNSLLSTTSSACPLSSVLLPDDAIVRKGE